MAQSKNVTVYSTPTCPYCHQVREWLKARGIEFTDHNVASDVEARNAMIQKSGSLGVPVIDVDGTIVVGFKRDELERLLG